jgi:hypothetical protein
LSTEDHRILLPVTEAPYRESREAHPSSADGGGVRIVTTEGFTSRAGETTMTSGTPFLRVRLQSGEHARAFGGAPPPGRITPGTALDLYTED